MMKISRGSVWELGKYVGRWSVFTLYVFALICFRFSFLVINDNFNAFLLMCIFSLLIFLGGYASSRGFYIDLLIMKPKKIEGKASLIGNICVNKRYCGKEIKIISEGGKVVRLRYFDKVDEKDKNKRKANNHKAVYYYLPLSKVVVHVE